MYNGHTHPTFIVTASSGLRLAGTFQERSSKRIAYSANAPLSGYVEPWFMPVTMSPRENLVTFFPS